MMLKCICERDCQIRIEGRAIYFKRGTVSQFEECPANFSVVGGSLEQVVGDDFIDYDRVMKEELVEMDIDISDLKKFLVERYSEINFAANIGVDTLVGRYLLARENKETIIDNTGSTKNTIVEVTRRLNEENTQDDLDSLLGD